MRMIVAALGVILILGVNADAQDDLSRLLQPQVDLSKLAPKSAQRMSIHFNRAPLSEILQAVGRAAGVDVRVSPEVPSLNRPVSLHFTNATFTEILAALMRADSFTYTIADANTLVVTPRQP